METLEEASYPKLSFCKDTIPNLTDWYQNNRRKKTELQQTINSPPDNSNR